MALFKISKGVKANLPSTHTEGYCYFTTDDGKFYIDTTNTAAGRILLNAGKADQLSTARTISLTGDVTGSATFDGSNNISITATVANNSHNHSASNITSGTLAIARGGTGATTAADACKSLGAMYLDPNDTAVNGEAALVNAGTFNGMTYAQVKADIAATVNASVQSVNGKTGAVTLNASDVGAAEAEHEHPYLPLDGGTIGGNVIFAKGANSRFPSHYYHNLYANNDRTTYVHAYPSPDQLEDGATRFDFRVADGNGGFDTLSERGGDGVYWNGSMLLDTGNYKSYCTPANIGAATASHTHDGKGLLPYVHNAGGISGENGYVKIARFTITGQYRNQAISLKLTQRRQSYVGTLHIQFDSATDAALSSFTKDFVGYKCYMHKPSAGVWDLYVLKTEGYDSVSVVEYDCGSYMINSTYNVTWTDEQVTTLPSGYVEATLVQNQHNYVPDVNDGRNTTFAYSKSDFTSPTYFAVWNSSELRTLPTSSVRSVIGAAAASHTHDTLSSSAAGVLTWSSDYMLSSSARPKAKLHFGTSTLYRFDSDTSKYYGILDDGRLSFSLSGTTLSITKS